LSCNDEKIVLVEPWMLPEDKKDVFWKLFLLYTKHFIKGQSEFYDLVNLGF
jgi:hypothetical protein